MDIIDIFEDLKRIIEPDISLRKVSEQIELGKPSKKKD